MAVHYSKRSVATKPRRRAWTHPRFHPQLQEAIIGSTVERFETIAERNEDLATLGLDLEAGP